MHSLKSEFYEVFEDSKYLGSGTLKLIDWLNKAQPGVAESRYEYCLQGNILKF